MSSLYLHLRWTLLCILQAAAICYRSQTAANSLGVVEVWNSDVLQETPERQPLDSPVALHQGYASSTLLPVGELADILVPIPPYWKWGSSRGVSVVTLRPCFTVTDTSSEAYCSLEISMAMLFHAPPGTSARPCYCSATFLSLQGPIIFQPIKVKCTMLRPKLLSWHLIFCRA